MRSGELGFDRGTLIDKGAGGLLIESKWDQYQINCTKYSVTRMAQRIKRIDDGVLDPSNISYLSDVIQGFFFLFCPGNKKNRRC